MRKNMNSNNIYRGTRRSFIKKLASGALSSKVLNSSLAASGLLWARGALAQSGVAPKRLVTIHITNGAFPATWHAQGTGTDFILPEGSSPFGAPGIREHCVFFDGLNGAGGHGPHDQCLTNNLRTSLDVYAASKISSETPYGSMHMAAFPQGGLSKVNGSHVPFELHPIKTYDRMFPEPQTGDGPDWVTIRRQGVFGANASALEIFKQGLNSVQTDRLDLHAESIAAMSRRVAQAAAAAGGACSRPFWAGVLSDNTLLDDNEITGAATELRTKLSFDLMALALKCDMTRVATFSFGHSGADVRLPLGFSWHDAQHGNSNAVKNSTGRKWFSEQIVYFMNLLAAEPDVDGRTLLDNTLIYITTDMGDGNAHDNKRHAIMLAGGLVNGGQAINMGGVQWDPLFDTVADAIGILNEADYPAYGKGSGPIAGVVKV